MENTEIFINKDQVTIRINDGTVHVLTWEQFDELEVAYDVVRRFSGAVRDRKFFIQIKEQNE